MRCVADLREPTNAHNQLAIVVIPTRKEKKKEGIQVVDCRVVSRSFLTPLVLFFFFFFLTLLGPPKNLIAVRLARRLSPPACIVVVVVYSSSAFHGGRSDSPSPLSPPLKEERSINHAFSASPISRETVLLEQKRSDSVQALCSLSNSLSLRSFASSLKPNIFFC